MPDEDSPESARRDRPETESGYGIPDDAEGTLPCSFVAEKLAGDRNYWVATTRPDRAFAWSDYPADPTRWTFGGE